MELFRSNKTISIDFGTDEVKLVEGKFSKKGIVINKNFSIKLPQGLYEDGEILDMDQMSYLLKTGLSENKISTGDVHGVINSSNIIIREIAMPMVAEDQIESILSYQLEDYIPIHPEDYVVKFIKLGTIYDDNIEKLSLLLVGVPRTIVETHLNLLKNINLKPTILDYQGNAISKLINFNDSINNYYSNNDTIASIDIGYNSTSLTIVKDGYIKVSRVIELGASNLINGLKSQLDIPEDEILTKIMNVKDISEKLSHINDEYLLNEGIRASLNDLMERIEMIFRYYKTREIGNDINLVLLHGGLSNINGIEKLFSDSFNVPCVKLNSLNKIKLSGTLSQYANAIGGLIRINGVK